MTLKIIAVNSSPNMEKGNTAIILTPFLEGMQEKGGEVELFYTKKLKIRPCQGEFDCAMKTPGECFQKDDMKMLYPKLVDADVWVFASPLYLSNVNGPMKNLWDRMIIPMGEVKTVFRDGRSRHPMREGIKTGKIVLVSSCGYWKIDNFNLLIEQAKEFGYHAMREYVGALLRPHAYALKSMLDSGDQADDVLEAARDAGRQLIERGKMSQKTLNGVSRELVPLESYVSVID
ncbi:MAG: flavodoxin family protein [Candidatus Thorarchaeota archaeon]|jgi:multimeric flavodoxin WrbA